MFRSHLWDLPIGSNVYLDIQINNFSYREECWERWLFFHFSTNGGRKMWILHEAIFFHFTALCFALKAVFHEAKFFDRIEIFFCLTSTQMKVNRNLLNLNNTNFGSIEKFRLVENHLKYWFKSYIYRRARGWAKFDVRLCEIYSIIREKMLSNWHKSDAHLAKKAGLAKTALSNVLK